MPQKLTIKQQVNLSNRYQDNAEFLGAIEMLHKIGNGENFTVLEFHSRLQRYKAKLLERVPELKQDAYFGHMFR